MRQRQLLALSIVFAMTILVAAPAGAVSSWGEPPIVFAGRQWQVKHSVDQVGPGPNVFTSDNVRVDRRGRLVMRIDQSNGVWRSSEVVLDESLGYGTYRFRVRSSLDDLDPNVVLGLFTWSDEPEQHNREIDIEFSRWGNPDSRTNAGYTVQPYDAVGHQHSWALATRRATEHEFTWRTGSVTFRSFDRRGRQLASWTFDDAASVPDPATAQVRINLWLFRGAAPTDGDPVEVVIGDFSFTPSA